MESRIRGIVLAHADSDKPYLIDSRRTLSYRETCRLAKGNAVDLQMWGFKGTHCLLLADNSLEFCVAFWSLVFADCVPVPINPVMSVREIQDVLSSSDARGFLASSRRSELAEALHAATGAQWVEVTADLALSLVVPAKNFPDRRSSVDVAVMLLSSGTTGLPKLVQLTHSNLRFVAAGHNTRLGLDSSDRVLVVLRLFHASAFVSQFLAHTLAGGTLVVFDEPVFTPKSFCRWIAEQDVTCTAVVPAVVRLLAAYRHVAEHVPAHLRYLCCAGDVLQQDLAVEMAQVWHSTSVVRTYGLTETATRVAYLFPEQAVVSPASIGTPLPRVSVRLCESSEVSAECEGVGEIHVRGPNVMPGYYGEAPNAELVFSNGWLRTGDLGRYNERGTIDFVGRMKNTIITRGMNISPEEVERAILEHPFIHDARVYSVKDEVDGERVCAEVVLSGQRFIDLAELHSFLRERLATYKYPRMLKFVSAIGRTATGKVSRA